MKDTIKMMAMVVGDIGANCYILGNEETKEAICFDPGAEGARIAKAVKEKGWKLTAIFLTHGHVDHIMGIEKLKAELLYEVPVYAGEEEQAVLGSDELNLTSVFGRPYVMQAQELLRDGQKLECIGTEMVCIHTPGHTKGGMCYYMPLQKLLISGDTLFEGSIGRTDFPTGDYDSLITSIREKLYILPNDTMVYTGHGEATTIENEKKGNMFVRG